MHFCYVRCIQFLKLPDSLSHDPASRNKIVLHSALQLVQASHDNTLCLKHAHVLDRIVTYTVTKIDTITIRYDTIEEFNLG